VYIKLVGKAMNHPFLVIGLMIYACKWYTVFFVETKSHVATILH